MIAMIRNDSTLELRQSEGRGGGKNARHYFNQDFIFNH